MFYAKYQHSAVKYENACTILQTRLKSHTISNKVETAWLFEKTWRRVWDSNPRALSDNCISSAARYDHFDISPYNVFQHFLCCFVSACCILSSNISPVNNKFDIFSKIGHIASISAICPYLPGFSPCSALYSTLCFPSKMPPQPPDLPVL